MSHHALTHRIRAEYLEMSGLRLTLPQAQRFCGADPALCELALSVLVDLKFLWVTPRGAYARLTDGADHVRAHPAQAVARGVFHMNDSRSHAVEPGDFS